MPPFVTLVDNVAGEILGAIATGTEGPRFMGGSCGT